LAAGCRVGNRAGFAKPFFAAWPFWLRFDRLQFGRLAAARQHRGLEQRRPPFRPHCGIGLYECCHSCSARKGTFSPFCHECGTKAEPA
jgi:hypothetical protein